MILREKLIALREQAGLSQLAVSNALGVSRQAVSRWESGASAPSRENLRALAQLYHVSLDWLCDEGKHTMCEQEATETEPDTDEAQKPEAAPLHPVHAQEHTAEQPVQTKAAYCFFRTCSGSAVVIYAFRPPLKLSWT